MFLITFITVAKYTIYIWPQDSSNQIYYLIYIYIVYIFLGVMNVHKIIPSEQHCIETNFKRFPYSYVFLLLGIREKLPKYLCPGKRNLVQSNNNK